MQYTAEQIKLRNWTRDSFQSIAGDAYAKYSKLPDQRSRFHSTREYYARLVEAGMLKAMLPESVGGTLKRWQDMAILLEEAQMVDPSLTVHLLGTALGLLPLIVGGTPEQKTKYIAPFVSGTGDALAGLTHSEPGGTANHQEKGGSGLGVTAQLDGDHYVINGEKLWTTNSGGWDGKGAALSLLVCRRSGDGGPEKANVDPASNVMVIAVDRETIAANKPGAYQLLGEPDLMGMIAATGPHTRYVNLRVPAANVILAPGEAAGPIEEAFGMTAAMVAAQAVGTMRAAFNKALKFAKEDRRGGTVPIIQRQSVADLLINCKIKIESSRLMALKALDSVDNGPGDAKARFESCLAAKIYGTDCAVPAVFEAMQVVGMTSYAESTGFPRLFKDAAVYPLFDGGNIGIRRRQFQRLMCEEEYQPWANL